MKHEFGPNIKYITCKNMCICQCEETRAFTENQIHEKIPTQTYTHWQRTHIKIIAFYKNIEFRYLH